MFYSVLLKEWRVETVIDLTPGTGTLARACMAKGWPYLGICRNAEHQSWLQNVLNKRALQVIVTKETALFERELADMVRDHFKEILEELNEEDNGFDEGIPPPPCLIFSMSNFLQQLRGGFSPATSRRPTPSSSSLSNNTYTQQYRQTIHTHTDTRIHIQYVCMCMYMYSHNPKNYGIKVWGIFKVLAM